METLWKRGPCSIREIQEAFPESKRPAYTTVQTTVYRMLEGKKAVRIVRRISNANIFDAAISRDDAGRIARRVLVDRGDRRRLSDRRHRAGPARSATSSASAQS